MFRDLVDRHRGDERIGLIFEDRSWTFDEVFAEVLPRSEAIATAMAEHGSPLHVGILANTTPGMYFWLLAILRSGATVVGLNDTRSADEIVRDAEHTDCDLIVTDHLDADLVEAVSRGVRVPTLPAEAISLPANVRPSPKDASRVPGLALLIFTSGTTAAPKAAMRSYDRLRDLAGGVMAQRELTPDDRLYEAMPWYHSNVLYITLMPALLANVSVILKRKFSASSFMSDIRQYEATGFNYVGKPLQYVLAQPATPDDRNHRLRYAMGNEANVKDIVAFTERFGVPVTDGFGSTEGGLVSYRSADMPAGSIGKDPEGTVRVFDPLTLEECPPAAFDETGRLLNAETAIGELVNTAGAGLFEGYYRNDEANQERTRSGWYWSGDLGYRDADGFLFFAGRGGDWLRVDGENFAAYPIEQILMRHPAVHGAAVLAVPDERVGDQVLAVLQVADGVEMDDVRLEEFLGAQQDLGRKWFPRYVWLTDSIPLSHTNKVDKRRLRADAFQPGQAVSVRDVDGRYVPFDDERRRRLVSGFEQAGRADQVPAGLVAS